MTKEKPTETIEEPMTSDPQEEAIRQVRAFVAKSKAEAKISAKISLGGSFKLHEKPAQTALCSPR